eukprot:1139140-Pelagomonas_calceolata.AAC.1
MLAANIKNLHWPGAASVHCPDMHMLAFHQSHLIANMQHRHLHACRYRALHQCIPTVYFLHALLGLSAVLTSSTGCVWTRPGRHVPTWKKATCTRPTQHCTLCTGTTRPGWPMLTWSEGCATSGRHAMCSSVPIAGAWRREGSRWCAQSGCILSERRAGSLSDQTYYLSPCASLFYVALALLSVCCMLQEVESAAAALLG